MVHATQEATLPAKVTGSAVEHPAHYNLHPSNVEAIEVIEYLTGNMFNTVKYVWRADHKGKVIEDIQKSLWYIKRELGRHITELPTIPQYVFDKTNAYVAAEPDKLRASIVFMSVEAHRELSTYKENLRRTVFLLEQLLERELAAQG